MDAHNSIILALTSLFSKEVSTILLATLPIFELRLAIPIATITFGLLPIRAYMFSVLGNLIPVIPLLLFFKYFFHRLEDACIVGTFFRWWFSSVNRRSNVIRKWGFWGLVVFVAIPLPITGAWTGCVAATLLNINMKKASLAIAIGVALAGILVSFAIHGIISLWHLS